MIEEYFLIIGSGLSGVSVSEYLLKKDLPFDIADTREVPPFEINPSKNGKAFFGDDFNKIDFQKYQKTLKLILLVVSHKMKMKARKIKEKLEFSWDNSSKNQMGEAPTEKT